jgi:hypothetical protein
MKEQVQKVFTGVWSAASGLVAAAAEAQKTCVPHHSQRSLLIFISANREIIPSLCAHMLKDASIMPGLPVHPRVSCVPWLYHSPPVWQR